jgi:uncharacterized protein
MHAIALRNKTTGNTIGQEIGLADTSWSRLCGLLGKRKLDAGRGVLICPSSGVHTFGMLFPIDVVALDKGMNVLQLWRALRPFRITSVSLRTRCVLELAAGEIDRCGIEVGHKLEAL